MPLNQTEATRTLTRTIGVVGHGLLRYGLALVVIWIGGMKFTAYEAEGIRGFVENSPLMSWCYSIFGVQGFSNVLGGVEIIVGILLVLKQFAPGAAVIGGVAAIGMFGTTLSFMVTTPGVFEASLGGFPALSVVPGQFLVKDIVLLGASVWATSDALEAWSRSN